MIRFGLMYGVLAAIIIAGFRRWFLTLCALIVLTALHDHRYFKESIAGIGGLKPYNVLLAFAVLHWIQQRRAEGLHWDARPSMSLGIVAYVLIVIYGASYAFLDIESLRRAAGWDYSSLLVQEILNPLKMILPAILLFDGCRSRNRMTSGMLSLAGLAFVTGAYIIKLIPVGSLADADSVLRYRHRIDRDLGLYPNDVVSIFVPGFWVALSMAWAMRSKLWRAVLLASAAALALALLLTQSRTGMAAFVVVGLVVGLLRFRKFTLILLVALPAVYFGLESLSANWSRGFAMRDATGVATDWNEVSNGRIELWGWAWHDIMMAPMLGQGRLFQLREPYGAVMLPAHPHNAYLDIWAQYGLLGLMVILMLFAGLLSIAWRVMKCGRDRLERAVGVSAFAAVLTNFVIAVAGHGFMPRVSSVITFCTCALACRIYVALVAAARQHGRVSQPARGRFVNVSGGPRPSLSR